MSEEKLVQYCSPTLAGIKTGSLFSCKYENGNIMREYFRSYNRRLRSKGIRLLPLQYRDGRALVYVYRPSMLSSDLNNAEACEILRSLGYSTEMPERCITHLIKTFGMQGISPRDRAFSRISSRRCPRIYLE